MQLGRPRDDVQGEGLLGSWQEPGTPRQAVGAFLRERSDLVRPGWEWAEAMGQCQGHLRKPLPSSCGAQDSPVKWGDGSLISVRMWAEAWAGLRRTPG